MRRTFLAVAGLALACGGKDPVKGGPPPPPVPILIQGDAMGNAAGRFTISRPGATLSSAIVTLNGARLPTTTDGFYLYDITPFLVPGDELRLRVELDGDAVEGRAAIPAFPVITMPTQNQVVTVGSDLDVVWTSAVDPSWWDVWIAANGAIVAGDSLPGTARTWSLPTTGLSAGQQSVAVFVRPWVRGSFTGPADSRSNMRVQGGQVGRNLVIAAGGLAPILIRGGDMGPQYESFRISRGGADVSTAVVSVNGVVIPTQANGHYFYDRGSELAPGEELLLRVELGNDVVEGRATILPLPVITAPIAGQVVTSGTAIPYTWTAATNPDWWSFGAYYTTASSGGNLAGDSLPATARSGSLSTATLPTSGVTSIDARLYAYLRGSFTGPVDPASTMSVRIAANDVTLTPSP